MLRKLFEPEDVPSFKLELSETFWVNGENLRQKFYLFNVDVFSSPNFWLVAVDDWMEKYCNMIKTKDSLQTWMRKSSLYHKAIS